MLLFFGDYSRNKLLLNIQYSRELSLTPISFGIMEIEHFMSVRVDIKLFLCWNSLNLTSKK